MSWGLVAEEDEAIWERLEQEMFSCTQYPPWKLALRHGGPNSISIKRGPWVQFP